MQIIGGRRKTNYNILGFFCLLFLILTDFYLENHSKSVPRHKYEAEMKQAEKTAASSG